MEHDLPSLSPEVIEELCRHYREAERAQEQQFERCEVRFNPQTIRNETETKDERG